MNNIQDWQSSIGEQVKWELRFSEKGKAIFKIIKRGKVFNIELLPNDITPLLNPLFEKYAEWFDSNQKTIADEFRDINEGIVLWLQDKYRITPTLKAFTKWFMLNRLNPAIIRLDFNANEETGEISPQVKVHFDFSTLLESYTTVIKNDLIEFCQWEKGELEKIDQSLSRFNQAKQEIEKLKSAAIAETIDFFKGKYKYEPEYQRLIDELNQKFDDYGIENEIKINSNYINTGRIKVRKKEIHSYLNTCQNEKTKIIVNEGNVVTNCKPSLMASYYCIYTFWELFHTAQLQKLNLLSTQSEEKSELKVVHAAILFAELENKDWKKFEEQESEIAKIKDYTTNKKARVTERDITLQELEYEEAAINSYTSQVIEAYPYQGMVFKHVPSLNEKHKRLLAESIAGLESLKKITKARLEAKRKQINLEQVQQHHSKTSTTSKTENEPVEGIPYFTPRVANAICEALKPHFKVEHHENLKTLLKTGKTANNKPLLFINNGNLLADAFNVLFENSFITKCIKKQLKEWIIQNFEYQADGKDVKHFTVPYLDKVMVKNKKNGFNMHSPKYPLPILDSICN